MIEALAPHGPHEALGERVGPGCADRGLDDLHALRSEASSKGPENLDSRSRIRNRNQWNVEVMVFLGYDRSHWERVQKGEQIGYTLEGIGEWTEVILPEPVGDRFVLDGAETD